MPPCPPAPRHAAPCSSVPPSGTVSHIARRLEMAGTAGAFNLGPAQSRAAAGDYGLDRLDLHACLRFFAGLHTIVSVNRTIQNNLSTITSAQAGHGCPAAATAGVTFASCGGDRGVASAP